MYSEQQQMKNRDTAQLMIEEMKNEIEKQKKLLDKRDHEIENLKRLLEEADARAEQTVRTTPANYGESLDMVYEIISDLKKYTPEEVLFYAALLLAGLMETKDVAIYMVVNKDYARLFSSTSSEAAALGHSIRYSAMGDLYRTLEAGRIFANEDMVPDLPLMASGVYAEDEIQVLLMFWGLSGQQMGPSSVKRLTVISTLIQNALLRAKRCMAGFRRHNCMEGTSVLNEKAFTTLTRTFLAARAKGLTECTLAEIVMGYQDYDVIASKISYNIRQTDYMGIMDGRKLYILLTNTDIENADAVKERLLKLGYQCVLKETI